MKGIWYLRPEDGESIPNFILKKFLCNSLAELKCGSCAEIDVQILSDYKVQIKDDGIGFPINIVEKVFTSMFACRDHNEHHEISSKLCRSSIVTSNAVSSILIIEIAKEGELWRIEFRDGEVQSSLEKVGRVDYRGTKVDATIDKKFCKGERINKNELEKWIGGLGVDTTRVKISEPDDGSHFVPVTKI